MKNIIPLFTAMLTLSSCGLFKSTFKHKSVQSEVIKTEVRGSKDSTGSRIDKSTVTTITTTKTTEELPDRKVTGQVKADKKKLQDGVEVIDSAGVTVKVYLDSATNILKAMANISGGKTTTETKREELRQNNITEQSGTKEAHEERQQVATDSKDKTADRKPIKTGVIVAIVAVIVFFVFLFFLIKVPKKNP